MTPAAMAPARVRWGEEIPLEQRDASPAIKIMPCTSTDYRPKDKNKQFGEWRQSGAAQASFARWQELDEQQLQRQQRAATGAAAADQAFNEWCQQQQLRRCPSPAGDKERHNRSERAGKQASPGRQQLQPPDELENFLAAQATAAEARDKGKGKGKPLWLPNPWASPTWNEPWADTWASHYGAGKGMRCRDRSTDHRPPKRQVKTVNPRLCAACGAPYERKARTQTGHGHCTNEKCIRSKADKEKYHGSGARTRTSSRTPKPAAAAAAAAAPPATLALAAAAAPTPTDAAATPSQKPQTWDLVFVDELIPLGDGRSLPVGASIAPQSMPQQHQASQHPLQQQPTQQQQQAPQQRQLLLLQQHHQQQLQRQVPQQMWPQNTQAQHVQQQCPLHQHQMPPAPTRPTPPIAQPQQLPQQQQLQHPVQSRHPPAVKQPPACRPPVELTDQQALEALRRSVASKSTKRCCLSSNKSRHSLQHRRQHRPQWLQPSAPRQQRPQWLQPPAPRIRTRRDN